MPKRVYPFEENLLPQLKTHVGQKEVDNGVSSDNRMKNVYNKTLSLLKAGAKALSQRLDTTAQMDSIDLPSLQPQSPCKLKSTSNLKQMLLTDKLQLKISDKVIKDVQLDLCGCCRVIDQSLSSKCYNCDQILCSSCLAECVGCSEFFCQNCSIPIYNYLEQNMCLNCYR